MDQISYGLQPRLHRSYRPQPFRLVEIEKPGGGKRGLGIPTVVDRMIQQAMHQVLNPLFDPLFSESSFGYRKGRNAEQAVLQAQRYMQEGKQWVVDVDFIERKLKLRINRTKSLITKYHSLTFLGFGFLPGKEARLKVPKEIQKRFRKKAKLLFKMGRGRNLQS